MVKSDMYVSIGFVSFALSGLLLLGNITGNVVGWMDVGTGFFGAVLFAIGVVVALILIRRK